jgi:hypothetical protein
MSKAKQAAVRRRIELGTRQRIDRQGARRRRAVRLFEEHSPRDAQSLAESFDGTRFDITKALAVMLGRRAKRFAPALSHCQAQHLTDGFGERGHVWRSNTQSRLFSVVYPEKK